MPQPVRTETIEHYAYGDLEPESQERARDAYREASAGWGYAWCEEWNDSLAEWCEALSIAWSDVSWGVTAYGQTWGGLREPSSVVSRLQGLCNGSSDSEELTGVRLWKWFHNQTDWPGLVAGCCPLTGYCGDEPLLDPIREFLAKPAPYVTLSDILDDCLSRWAFAFRDDLEFQDSDEYVVESIEANDYTFTIDGNLLR